MHRLVVGTIAIAAVASALVVQPTASSPVSDDANRLERPFAPGGRITMNLSAGDYTIEGSSDARIRLQWETRDPEDARDVKVQANVEGTDAQIKTDGPSNGFRVTIEIPARSDVSVRLSAGDLTLRDVEGHKDISAWAGDLKIGIGRAADYRRVDASVTAGDLQAAPFKVSKGGLFRSFTWEGSGRYDLRARLTAGDLTLRAFEEPF
ncbi:MAG: hypothetical protein GEU99_03530 [Luteitalea sp.]|nr:hypothetical protein [Luteitalea sp.]